MEARRQRVLIVGFGYVGSQAATLLTSRGHQVTGLRRHPRPGSRAEHILQGDVNDPTSLRRLRGCFDRVIYAISPGSREDAAYEQAYPLGLKNVLHACDGIPTTFVSSTAVYAQQGGASVDETSPAEATTFSARRLREAEALLKNDEGHIVVRACGIYGPGRTRLVSRLILQPLEDSERAVLTSRIHRDDLAAILTRLVEAESPQGLYIASDPQPSSLGDMQDWLRAHPLAEKFSSHVGAGAISSRPTAPTRQRSSRRLLPRRLLEERYPFQFPSFKEGYDKLLNELLIDKRESFS